MPESRTSVVILAAAALIAGGWSVAELYMRQRRRLPLPPGPPKKSWLTGNAEDMPKTHIWFKFTEWAKEYGKNISMVLRLIIIHKIGDVVHLQVHANNIIIVSSYEGILELFEKRGSIYSQRPQRMMPIM